MREPFRGSFICALLLVVSVRATTIQFAEDVVFATPGSFVEVVVRVVDVENVNAYQVDLVLGPHLTILSEEDIQPGSFFSGPIDEPLRSTEFPAIFVNLSDPTAGESGTGPLASFDVFVSDDAPVNSATTVAIDEPFTFLAEPLPPGGSGEEIPYIAGGPMQILIIPEPSTLVGLVLGVVAISVVNSRRFLLMTHRYRLR